MDAPHQDGQFIRRKLAAISIDDRGEGATTTVLGLNHTRASHRTDHYFAECTGEVDVHGSVTPCDERLHAQGALTDQGDECIAHGSNSDCVGQPADS